MPPGSRRGPSVKMLDSSYYFLRISWPVVALRSLKFASKEQDRVGMLCCAAVPGSQSPSLFQTRH